MHHVNKLHKSLEPLKWLVGKWKTIKAEISHPTKPQTLKFTEHMEFLSFGAPLLVFSSKSNRVKQGGKARHLERGFLSINDDHYTVAFATVASLTLSTLEEGYVQDQCLCLKSASIAEKKFSMYPAIK
ncbi:uncharacterized protein LOC126739109 isoform X2 [Anthonomus grandis grandis]|uniref:uncharacterized protein LOC126739109 isoform X2 n=1 Tax=Anthonomus grandis grandis TaxID=2921223 RepID=UPI0021661EE8|nr:uncharacterized protein LOC126739109 isoform X2 [Anthonomus grandis grandis]